MKKHQAKYMAKPLTEDQIREIIRDELHEFIKRDKFVFTKLVQFLDGRQIQTGRTNGLSICTETDQKIGFYGESVTQQSKINDPSGGSVADAIDSQARASINSIIDVLEAFGLTAK